MPPDIQLPCNHYEIVANLTEVSRQVALLEREIQASEESLQAMKRQLDALQQWVDEDGIKSRWYYERQAELEVLVESQRWILRTRNILAWLAGALAACVGAWHFFINQFAGLFKH